MNVTRSKDLSVFTIDGMLDFLLDKIDDRQVVRLVYDIEADLEDLSKQSQKAELDQEILTQKIKELNARCIQLVAKVEKERLIDVKNHSNDVAIRILIIICSAITAYQSDIKLGPSLQVMRDVIVWTTFFINIVSILGLVYYLMNIPEFKKNLCLDYVTSKIQQLRKQVLILDAQVRQHN